MPSFNMISVYLVWKLNLHYVCMGDLLSFDVQGTLKQQTPESVDRVIISH